MIPKPQGIDKVASKWLSWQNSFSMYPMLYSNSSSLFVHNYSQNDGIKISLLIFDVYPNYLGLYTLKLHVFLLISRLRALKMQLCSLDVGPHSLSLYSCSWRSLSHSWWFHPIFNIRLRSPGSQWVIISKFTPILEFP